MHPRYTLILFPRIESSQLAPGFYDAQYAMLTQLGKAETP